MAKEDSSVVLDPENPTEEVITEPAKGEEPIKGKSEERAEREEVARLRRELNESRQESKFWADKAAAATKPEPKQAKGEEPSDDDPDKFIEDLTKDGAKALKKYIKPGATLDEIGELIDRKLGGFTANLQQQGKLAQEFPDLAKPDSRLYKLTQEELAAIEERDPERAKQPGAVHDAARMAKLRLESEAREADRQRRVNAQSNYGGEPYDEDEPGSGSGTVRMTRNDRLVASAMGISDKDFLAQKQAVAKTPRKVIR